MIPERLYTVTEAMIALAEDGTDPEVDHQQADRLLVQALRILAERIDEVMPERILRMLEAYESLEKWYA